MNLIYANPLTLVFHYLAQFIYGTPLTELQASFSLADKKLADDSRNGRQVYDFIVVGGGSAGSVVASRLSEDEGHSVLLLESGGDPFPLTSVVAFPLVNLGNPNIDWRDTIVPQQRACHSFKNNAGIYNRGKALGGGSLLNFMIAMRGNPNDYDRWAVEVGDDSWNYENMLPFFKKMENYEGEFQDDSVHGSDGPLNVAKQPFAPLVEEWVKGGQDMGFKILDPNGHQSESFFPFETTTKGGTRFSTHRAYLYPVLMRENLKIQTYSTATKILLNSQKKAVGVQYEHGGRSLYARASREIILSCGAIGSAQLLMLSGIGPRRHLEGLGITSKIDLPAVGQNLQDHQMTWVGPFTFDPTKVTTPIKMMGEATLHEYILNGTGPFSGTGAGGGALKKSTVNPGWPDLYLTQLTAVLTPAVSDLFEFVFDFKPATIQKYFSADYGKLVFFIAMALGLPKTRGEVKLKSKNYTERMHIDPNYFHDPQDATAMLEGVKFALEVTQTESMQKIGTKLTQTLLPGCESFKSSESDDYWRCYFKHWTSTMWHYSCTCKMGKGPEDSVVDSKLRVMGTKGLRVMDASVMPWVTNTNTNLPTIVIAEKGADMIKKFWKEEEANKK